jgi:hypothetical protein
MKKTGKNPVVWILSAGYEVISITASCWHVRKPTTETIALWRRVSRVPMSFYFRIGERKLRSLWADSTNFSTSKETREYCIQKIIIESIIIFRDLPFVDPNRNSKDFLRAPPQPFRGVAATPHRSFAASAVLSLHHNPPKYYAVTFLFASCVAVCFMRAHNSSILSRRLQPQPSTSYLIPSHLPSPAEQATPRS